MAKNSSIEWTHHTFNPWWGCSKVSPACRNCYAESWAKRVGSKVWGSQAERRFFSDNHWKEPLKWNQAAEEEGERKRVFCASMADVFERRKDVKESRERLWRLIEETPMLDWLLLTKRPQNIESMSPWSGGNWPDNIWLGATAETQVWADKRIPHLMKHDVSVRFLSCEPLLGPLDLGRWINSLEGSRINWVIAGGESGPKSRVMKPSWVRSLRDDCEKAGVAFHFKQWGHWAPSAESKAKAKNIVEVEGETLVSVGKKQGGRELDGRFWDELPQIVI